MKTKPITRFTKEQLIKRIEKQIDINATIIERLGDDSAAASELAVETATMDIKILDVALASLEAEPDYIRYDCGCCGWETLTDWRDNDVCPKCNHKPMGKTKLFTAPPAPAPVVPEGLRVAMSNAGIAAPESDEMLAATCDKHIQALVTWVRNRKPFQPAPVFPETLPCSVELKPGLIIGKGCKTETLLTALQRRADYCAKLEVMTPEERADHDAGIEEFKTMLPQPAPVVPDDGYQHLSELYHAQEKRLFKLAQRINGPSFDKYAYSPSQAIDVLETAIFGEKEDNGSDCRAAMLERQGVDHVDGESVYTIKTAPVQGFEPNNADALTATVQGGRSCGNELEEVASTIPQVPAKPVSSVLYSFYIAYNEWLENGAEEDCIFSRDVGLCASAYDYFDHIGADVAVPLEELHAAFEAAGLNGSLPFNDSKYQYSAESKNGECYLNSARVEWVQRHIAALSAPVVPLPDVVSVLLNHLEDVLPDDAFNLIDVKAWNAVSMLTCPPAPVVSGEYGDAYQGARDDLAIWKRRALEAEDRIRHFTTAATDVLAERQHQIDSGFTPEKDDIYGGRQLIKAATCYANSTEWKEEIPYLWPWHPHWWKPTNPRRDLLKAGALILAEIERIDRAVATNKGAI